MNTKFKWPLAEKDIDVFSTEVKRGIETLYATCTDNVVNDALCRANLAQQVSQLLTSYIDLRLIFKFHIICDSTNNVEPLNATPVLDVVFNIEQHGRITKPRVTLSFKQKSLWIKLLEIEDGRYEALINALDIRDECEQCDFFNKSINDYRQGYRCHCPGSCIDATLTPQLIQKFNKHLGYI